MSTASDIHICSFLPVGEAALERIRAVDPRVNLHSASLNLVRWMREPNHPEIDADAAMAEAEEIRNRDRVWFTFFSGNLACGAPALDWIALASAGADQILRQPPEPHVRVTKMPGLAARVIAEWVLAFMLMDCKQMPRYLDNQRQGYWQRFVNATDPLTPRSLEGATVAIIGYGAIGSEIARLVDALGVRVIGVRRRAEADGSPPPDAPASVEAIWPPDRLHEVLGEADYSVLAVPLTDATREMIGEPEIAAMKPGAALINIARGEVVDWPAQIAALRDGRLRACYTDVTSPEPLPDGHPDWDTPNLVITPHNSGLMPDYFGKAAVRFADNLSRYLHDEPLLDVVDREAGY